jgi:hypothetical protein
LKIDQSVLNKKPGLYEETVRIGGFAPMQLPDGTVERAKFNGFARSETLDRFLGQGWRKAVLMTTGYTEGKPARDYEVPAGNKIEVVFLKTPMGMVFNIVTRAATGLELQVHDRFPRFIKA